MGLVGVPRVLVGAIWNGAGPVSPRTADGPRVKGAALSAVAECIVGWTASTTKRERPAPGGTGRRSALRRSVS